MNGEIFAPAKPICAFALGDSARRKNNNDEGLN
jgi:hypothetical protein